MGKLNLSSESRFNEAASRSPIDDDTTATHMTELNLVLKFALACTRQLRTGTSEIISWIEQGWLQATTTKQAHRASYRITPEALSGLYKHHLQDLLKRRIPNHSLFEAYVQYCFSPKHTTGEQLLEVSRDKREREAFAALHNGEGFSQEHEVDDDGTFDT